MKKPTENNPTSFATGFAIGALVGVIGYLVYGTSRGENLKENFQKELDRIRKILYREGLVETKNASFVEIMSVIQNQAQGLLDGMPKKKRTYAKKSNRKFKGV